jgi:hypothetical protein
LLNVIKINTNKLIFISDVNTGEFPMAGPVGISNNNNNNNNNNNVAYRIVVREPAGKILLWMPRR